MENPTVRIYATTWCSDCNLIEQFLEEKEVPFQWIDVEKDPEGVKFLEKVNNGLQLVPTVAFPDGSTLTNPSIEKIAEKLGLSTDGEGQLFDLIVIGAGPAGLTAAIYAAREHLSTLVLERGIPGGQIALTEQIDNYPGFPEGIGGFEFAERIAEQARRYGVEILSPIQVTRLAQDGRHLAVETDLGDRYKAHAVLIGTGSSYRRLGAPGEEHFIGRGVSYCATCDAPFFTGKDVLVVGGGDSAAQEGLFLTKFASTVTVLVRRGEITASRILADKLSHHPKVKILYHTVVKELRGDTHLTSALIRDVRTGEEVEMPAGGLFVFIGMHPNTEFLKETLKLDAAGFIITGHTLETSLPGVFAAGDVRAGSTKQVASAAGEGATAALMISEYLRERIAKL